MKNALVLIAACAGFTAALAGNVQIQVLDKDGQPVPDAVVVLYPAASQAAAPTLLPPNPVVEQEKMRFVPAVSVVAAGTTVRFVNRDTWDHHVRGTAAGAASFQAAADGAGFELRLISSVALARTREALHNGWDKNDPKDAQVILHMLRIGATQAYVDPLAAGINDLQELSKTHETISKAKTQTWHRILTHYLPLYFPV